VRHWLTDVQTTDVAPGGSAAFDAHFDVPGVYGFVSHTFANVEKGGLGAIDVGAVTGTMTHEGVRPITVATGADGVYRRT